ncbi:MAG: hemolysin III family protein [Pirellulaceae bacterium]
MTHEVLPIIDPHEVMYLSPADERANIATHTLGFLLSIVVGAVLWRWTQPLELGARLSCIVFAASMATVYLFSTLSHAVHEPAGRIRMRA